MPTGNPTGQFDFKLGEVVWAFDGPDPEAAVLLGRGVVAETSRRYVRLADPHDGDSLIQRAQIASVLRPGERRR